jgi:nucleoside-diphosphate-sugar epimerase
VAWRPGLEHEILASRDVLDVAIVRPAGLYGGDGSIWKLWLEPIRNAAANNTSVSIFGNPAVRVVVVHKDDLADLYVKLVEQVRT